MAQYNHKKIESKWRKKWEKEKRWNVNIKRAKKPYYNLMMFPYPSAEGLHVGNVYAFTGSDIHGRFRRMQGNDVFEPIGYDAFGIHSENFAIKKGIHPRILIKRNTKNFERQLKLLGSLFDWDHAVDTTQPEYYKWTQWLFLQLYKAGLAYKAKASVDWCPSCKTVLADEQVINGKCERCGTEVIQKELEQWFFRITKYADKLLKNLEWIDWSERTKIAQRNWIGKSEGAEIEFKIQSASRRTKINVFTTRPDTLFGATYMVLAPEHNLVDELRNRIENWEEIEAYRKEAKKKNELERTELAKEKTGVELKGIKAINPANKEEIPVYIADYVLASYGTGAIMAVPAHDQRDWEFAKKYNLPIAQVICQNYPEKICPILEEAYIGAGYLVGSGQFDGMPNEKAKWAIKNFVKGKKTIKYHLRDWLISRQRYWGPPIPIVYCDKCGTVPVPEKDLPVELPYVKNFRPEGTGKSPLASVKSFVRTKCPTCKGPAQRETDVSDTFLDSAWYFLRYPSTRSARSRQVPFEKELTKKWLPVDMYIGGQEHAALHLLYSRFVTMALKDMGHIEFEEPFAKFRAHGLLIKEGKKMSKSKGNVVNPDEFIEKFGADTVRTYLMFLGPFSEGGDWSDKGIIGVYRFLNRIWVQAQKPKLNPPAGGQNQKLETLRHRTIKKVTEDLENLHYNTAIAALMEFSNEMQTFEKVQKEDIKNLLIMLAPFAPYITEELWQRLGNAGSVHDQPWPKYDAKKIQQERVKLVLQVNGKVRDVIEVDAALGESETKRLILQNEKVQNYLAGKEPKKIIFVPGRLVNVVI
ncbi:MAG: leucine--tRNA ligase [Candidatus Wildermuthbacteria bacterium RIFCSPLOWO2_01_FULL_48_29]|uniref:Leucine--tRNA ligase n=2 Tax=Candidatus Wildermuthiibacteriota TaxID=1817923 RepID=A0A1G2RL41_9BACT|nr:MAG: leucine--tRNA ligase [Candidatus Wildermuthbacteria bacterium RIFCSPLOWO2_01_FULL_48_29]